MERFAMSYSGSTSVVSRVFEAALSPESWPLALGLSFLDLLLASLRADLAYARFEDPRGGCEIETARAEGDPHAAERAQEIGQALIPALASLNGASGSVVVPNPLNNQRLRIAF